MARSASSRLARARARTTPPTSGETIISSPACDSAGGCRRDHRRRGNRLSVGMSKKPWIWPACRSMVSTRSAPARVIRLATSLAEIGVRAAGFAVLPGVAEIGHHRRDPPGRRARQRVDADQQLHQVVVGRIAGRLDDEDVLAADVLVDDDEDLVVGEAADLRAWSAARRDRRRSPRRAAGWSCRPAASSCRARPGLQSQFVIARSRRASNDARLSTGFGDVAIQRHRAPCVPWIASPQPVRKDGRLSTPYGSQ